MKIPESILFASSQNQTSEAHRVKSSTKSQFRSKVVVTDDFINVEGEGAPNIIGLFKADSRESSSMNRYECNLADLPVIILQQVSHTFVIFFICMFSCTFSLVFEIIFNLKNRLWARLFVGFTRKL